jgi:hypothetical protein
MALDEIATIPEGRKFLVEIFKTPSLDELLQQRGKKI